MLRPTVLAGSCYERELDAGWAALRAGCVPCRTGKATMNPARTPPAHSQAFLMLLLGWHVHGGA